MNLPTDITINPGPFVSRFAPKTELMTKKELSDRIDRVPDYLMREWGAKLFLLMNLTWGYVETVCSMCVSMRKDGTKKLVRIIRELKREYDRFRSEFIGEKENTAETEMGEWFEENFIPDFNNLFNGINLEASKLSSQGDERMYVVSVHQSLTLIEAVKGYARHCDGMIKGYGAWTCECCMVPDQFLAMHEVMKRFPTASESGFIQLRKMSAKILENRLHQLEVGIENGKIWIDKKNTMP